MISPVDRMVRRLRPESSPSEEAVFPFGDLYATLRNFDETIIVHFPLGSDRGLVVSMEPEATTQLDTFVSGCLDRLEQASGSA